MSVTHVLGVACKTCAAFFPGKWLDQFIGPVKEIGKACDMHSFLVGNSRCYVFCLLCIACSIHVLLGMSVQIMLCQDAVCLVAYISQALQASETANAQVHEHLHAGSSRGVDLQSILTVSCVGVGRAAIEDLSSSSSAIRLSLITTTRLLHWADGPAGIKLQTKASPLPLQRWVSAWGSSIDSSRRTIHGHEGCRGGLICARVEDVAYMATSLRQRVLVWLNRMNM